MPEVSFFAFLEIYDAPKATVSKLKQGSSNLAKGPGDLLWKNKLFFRVAKKGQAAAAVDVMVSDPLVQCHKPRLLFATDGEEVYCRDIKTDKTVDIDFHKLNNSFDFFLSLAGIEPYEGVPENPADVKATGRLAKLYDAILESNPDWIGRNHTHELNLFMTRMLFCFFAEDTSIFEKGLFTSTLLTLTSEDGANTASVLETLFSAMNAPDEARTTLPEFARRFPFVNGGLFREATPVPKFSKRACRLLKECGDLHWREINPDIFGSMIQAVVEPEMRGDMGLHYTSVPNIMKVLRPLFLLSLEEDFEAARDSELEVHGIDILGAREAHPGKTITWLYNPETMPTNLLKAHRDLDDTLERIYIGRPFKNDTERLEHLFKLYATKITKKDAVKARRKAAA